MLNPNHQRVAIGHHITNLLLLALLASPLIGCGDDDGGNPECREHTECEDDQICDPATGTCISNTCGDGVIRQAEACDDASANSDTLPDACRTDCTAARCGDGVEDTDEACDEGAQNGVSPSSCLSTCQLTTCGDLYVGGDEVCDGTNFAGETCDTQAGHASGSLVCAGDCLSVSADDCYTCGDGAIDGPEVCDGTHLGTGTCASLQYDGGELGCASGCLAFEPAGCWSCGDGVCEHSTGENTEVCPEDCGWVKISSSGYFSCGVKADGTLWCWGGNDDGTLGTGDYQSSALPVQVHGLTDIVSVDGMWTHACALKGDGTVWCWGRNYHGELGNGTTTDSTIPVQALVTTPVTTLAVGDTYTCVSTDDGAIQRTACWGLNTQGKLGDGTTTESIVPIYVSTPLTQVSVFFEHTCAVRVSDQKPMCWGGNSYGQLGDGTLTPSALPVLVDPPNSFTARAVAVGSATSCALTTDDAVRCWGAGYIGQLGNNTQTNSSPTSVAVFSLPAATLQLSGGYEHFCVRVDDTDKTAYCWGANNVGQLGDGTQTRRLVPTQVDGLTEVVDISAGDSHTCAVTDDGAAHCWGINGKGQLGDGQTYVQSLTPVLVVDPYGP